MVKGQNLNLPSEVAHVIDQLERHCMAPDGSLISKPSYNDLQLARDEMCGERLRYLEAMAIYSEATAMVEEYYQTFSGGLYPQLELINSPQVYETLEHQLVVAEAAQRLRLPLISSDGEVHDEDIEKLSVMSRSSIDSTNTSATINSSNAANYATLRSSISGANSSFAVVDPVELGIGGVPDRFLGIVPAYLWQTQLQETPSFVAYFDMTEYSMSLSLQIEDRLKLKCDTLSDAFVLDETDSLLPASDSATSQLPERVRLMIKEIEREEAALQEDLHSADRKFAEYYNVLEQMLGVLIKLVKDLNLEHQHNYDELRKTWFCKRCVTMNAKLSVLQHVLLRQTYTRDSIPALHKIRKYLVEATEEASTLYNKAVTRLHEYQGVDPHFADIAREYQDIVQELGNMQWTIQQVEMDLKHLPNSTSI